MNSEDTLIPKINDVLTKKLLDSDLKGETINLSEKEIKPCLGCFKCWIETPGICIIDDYGRDVARKMIQADYLIYLTPITYGGYSAELKKAVDRSICLLSPFFRIHHDEIHHEKRYDKYPNLLVIGTLTEPNKEQEEIFKTLVHRNHLNNFAEKYDSTIIYYTDELSDIYKKIETSLKVVGE